MEILARFTIRPAADDYSRGDLILGAMFNRQDTPLKSNRVYEIREILDTLVIVNIGESVMGMYPAESKVEDSRRGLVSNIGWCSEVGNLLDVGRGVHLISRDEWRKTYGI